MGVTGAIIAGVVVAGAVKAGDKYNKDRVNKLQQGALDSKNLADQALTPPTIPNPPDVKTQQAAAGIAMTNAALAARRMAKGSGLASTILTSPTGAPAAPTAVKTLLGT